LFSFPTRRSSDLVVSFSAGVLIWVFSCQPFSTAPEHYRVPPVWVVSEMGNVFRGTATSTSMCASLRPSLAFEIPRKTFPISSFKLRRMPSPVRRTTEFGLLSAPCMMEFPMSPHHKCESGGEERLSGTILGHGWTKLSAHGRLERVPERRSLPPPLQNWRAGPRQEASASL